MAKITFPGLNDYELMISRLSKNAADIAGRAIYTGAGIVADEIKSGIQSLPIVRGYGTAENPLPGGVTQPQKQGLLDGLGIGILSVGNIHELCGDRAVCSHQRYTSSLPALS